MFLRLAAFNSKRLYIGLVSVRPSVRPSVPSIDSCLSAIGRYLLAPESSSGQRVT